MSGLANTSLRIHQRDPLPLEAESRQVIEAERDRSLVGPFVQPTHRSSAQLVLVVLVDLRILRPANPARRASKRFRAFVKNRQVLVVDEQLATAPPRDLSQNPDTLETLDRGVHRRTR